MATFNYSDLEQLYNYFGSSVMQVKVNGKDLAEDKHNLLVSDLEVVNTADYEAAMASFMIYNTYDRNMRQFMYSDVKKYCQIGACVVISLGYELTVREVFRGFISSVGFSMGDDVTGIRITCMDVKGIMMSGNYCKQLNARYYSAAVREILQRTVYEKLQSSEIITSMAGIADTPDKAAADSEEKINDHYIEMNAESDYEFVVKAAKKFNFEFYTLGGNVYFKESRNNTDILIELNSETGLTNLDIEYDITGQVGSVETRNMDVGSNKMYNKKTKLTNLSGKEKSLVSSIEKVYIDPTIRSKEEAEYRAAYLQNDISYRYGTLRAEFVGLPELSPGFFVRVSILGDDTPLDFYLTEVRHVVNDDGYATFVVGKACKMGTVS